MKTAIYELAMYEIVNKIKTACPSYYFPGDGGIDRKSEISLILDLFKYTDQLDSFFPDIDADTYCMLVCGTIMQMYVSGLVYHPDFESSYFDRLRSRFADDKTVSYFKHIYHAIGSIQYFFFYNADREIFEWPNDFRLEFHKDQMTAFHQELLAAIDEESFYSYAYCLISVPYFSTLTGISFNFETSNTRLRGAFARAHKVLGDDLFDYLSGGFFNRSRLSYEELNVDDEFNLMEGTAPQFNRDIASYAAGQGYDVSKMDAIEIKGGYFIIENEMIPAGIPFFRGYDAREFNSFVNELFETVPEKNADGISSYAFREILTDQGNFRIEIKNQPLYRALCCFMPVYETYPKGLKSIDSLRKAGRDNMLKKLLDVSAEEMERLHKANEKLEILNEELRKTNDSLSKHIKLNEELIRSISHSSRNILNAKKLAKTGQELNSANEENPTLDELHLDGLSLISHSEREAYLSRQLASLTLRCSADLDKLTRQIRGSILKETGEGILSPISFALKTIISRVLFYEEDLRSEHILRKLRKAGCDILQLQSSFMLDVLAKDTEEQKVISWLHQNHFCQLDFSLSERWKGLLLKKDGAFYDLIVEIVCELFLNAMSHGKLSAPITMEFGQAEEFRGRPRWLYILCRNSKAEKYEGGREEGISTLRRTISLLNNDDDRGIICETGNNDWETKVWLRVNLTKPWEE